MGSRTIRLDDRAEMAEPPYAVFRRLDLGPGGYAAAVGEKHGR